MKHHCKALNTKDTTWNFCPNVGVSFFFAVIFGILLVAHSVQAVVTRKFYSIVIMLSALLQVLTFVFRILSIHNPANVTLYALWFVIILVAPLFTNAYVYMIMGRMVHNFLPNGKLVKIQARRFGLYFVLLDILAFLIQVAGASSAAGNNISTAQINRGLHLYMIGVGVQQIFILIFLGIAFRFQLRVRREATPEQQTRAMRLLFVSYAALALITLRIIFRLVEWSNGLDSSIPNHEWTMYVFDTTPMWFAILLFNVVHPGRLMPGKESDLPSRKEYRREKRAAKEAKRLALTGQASNYSSVSGSPGVSDDAVELRQDPNKYLSPSYTGPSSMV